MLITAAHLDLFGWIGKQEKSPRALAAHFGGEAAAWEIFLNALCGMGLMRKRAEKFANSAFSSRHLSGAGAALLLPNFDAWNSWGGLASSLTSGNRPRSQKPFVADRAQAKRLLCALHIHAQQIAPYLIEKLPLAGCQTLLDVGGGLGTYSRCFLSSLSSPSGNSCRASECSSSGAPGSQRLGYGEKSAGHRSGFFPECSATGIR